MTVQATQEDIHSGICVARKAHAAVELAALEKIAFFYFLFFQASFFVFLLPFRLFLIRLRSPIYAKRRTRVHFKHQATETSAVGGRKSACR
jgi:hypothetical protein